MFDEFETRFSILTNFLKDIYGVVFTYQKCLEMSDFSSETQCNNTSCGYLKLDHDNKTCRACLQAAYQKLNAKIEVNMISYPRPVCTMYERTIKILQ